jgi:hypothetical protein
MSRAFGVTLIAGWVLTAVAAAPADHDPAEILGSWKGTSTCSDRVAAPACHD